MDFKTGTTIKVHNFYMTLLSTIYFDSLERPVATHTRLKPNIDGLNIRDIVHVQLKKDLYANSMERMD